MLDKDVCGPPECIVDICGPPNTVENKSVLEGAH